MSFCRNWKFWAIFGGLAVAIALAAPGARATLLPLVFIAACPLFMVLMGVGVARGTRRRDDRATSEAPTPSFTQRETVPR